MAKRKKNTEKKAPEEKSAQVSGKDFSILGALRKIGMSEKALSPFQKLGVK